MKDIIKKIIQGEECEEILNLTLNRIYKSGLCSYSDMEILSYLALYRRKLTENRLNEIVSFMALYYKGHIEPHSVRELIFNIQHRAIKNIFNQDYTPIQVNILENINTKHYFSFSAPTSTGKSFVFRNLIEQSQKDVVIVLPSRSLIYEYELALSQQIANKRVNILTHIDKINTENSDRNVFVVTPERCRDLFKDKGSYAVGMFLFDEAQLGDEDSVRGLYFDSIVRRCVRAYPKAKLVFAQPFVVNPEAQFEKNNIDCGKNNAKIYQQRNVGQIYLEK